MGFSQALLIPRSSGLPLAGRLLHVKVSENVTQGGATGFTATDKCKLVGSAIDPGTDDFWVEFWFTVDSVTATGNRGIIGTGAGGVGEKGFLIYQINNGMGFILSDGSGSVLGTVATGIAANTVYECVCCFDRDGNMTPYLNAVAGTPVDISSCQLSLGSLWAATILGAIDTTGFFGGVLQCVRVGIGSLPTAAEIAAMYNAKNPLVYAELPAAIAAKLGDDGAAWDLNESLTDATHQALDSHGTNHLTFTPSNLWANAGFETAGAGGADVLASWDEVTSGSSTISDETTLMRGGSHALRMTVDASGSNVQVSQGALTVGHAYSMSVYARAASGTSRMNMGTPITSQNDDLDETYARKTFSFTADNAAAKIGRAGTGSASTVILVDDVELYAARLYPANGFQTAIASDSSGNGNHATLTGFSTKQAAEAWQPRGEDGHALTFDGVGNHGKVAHTTALNAYPLTIAGWIKTTTVARTILNKYRSSSANGYWLGMDATGHLTSGYYGASSYCDSPTAVSTGVVTDGVWHHVGITLDAAGITYYIDGVASGTDAPWNSAPSAATTTTDITLACAQLSDGSTFSYFPGQMADWRIYGSALTPAQMAELATLAEDEEVAGLTPGAHWTFGDGPSYTVSDGDPVLAINSCEGNRRRFVQDNILKRPLWIASGLNGRPALRFDGVDDYLAYAGAALGGDVGTVVLYGRWTAAVDGTFLALGNTSDATRCLQMRMREAAHANAMFYQRDADTQDVVRGSTNTVVDTPACWVFASDGSALFMWVNGVAQTLTGSCADWFANVTGANLTAIGALYRTSPSSFDALDLAELLVYDRVLSASELARALRYGVQQYGIAP